MRMRIVACLACAVIILTCYAQAQTKKSGPVVFLHYWSDDFQGVDAMVANATQADPSLNILVRPFEHESFKVSIQTILSGDSSPDVISYWAGQRTQTLVDKGLISPVDDVWEAQHLDASFSPVIKQACTYDGKLYGVPVTLHWVGLFYNKKIFAEHNLQPPTTWEDFLKVCEVLKKAGVAPLAVGVQDRWPAQFWFDFFVLRTAGPAFHSRLMQGQASFTDPGVKRAVGMWQELINKDYFLRQSVLYDWSVAAKAVHGGQAAMTLNGTWLIGFYENQLGWKGGEDFDAFPFPVITPGLPFVNIGPVDLVALSARGNQQGGRKVLAALAKANAQEAMSEASGALTPRRADPLLFYPPLKQRIAKYIDEGDAWAFAFDLSFPEQVAQAGLDAFAAFQQRRIDAEAMLLQIQKAVAPKQP